VLFRKILTWALPFSRALRVRDTVKVAASFGLNVLEEDAMDRSKVAVSVKLKVKASENGDMKTGAKTETNKM
jgi:hypothetical protein